MKLNNKTILFLLLIGALSGCAALVPDSMLKGIHQEMDSNRDGYLKTFPDSEEEIARQAKKKGMTVDEYSKWDFNRTDLNKDGKITAQELIDLFRKE